MGDSHITTIVLPKVLDEKIKAYCRKNGLTRSEYLRSLAVRDLERIESHEAR